MDKEFDIVVVGAGTAGVVAALQAARTGLKTLLIEKNSQPGGTMTSGGISFPGLFYAWKKQIIAGIGWELVSEAAAESKLPLPEFEAQVGMTRHPQYQVKLNALIYAALCDEKLKNAGIKTLYHAMIAGIRLNGNGYELDICTRSGVQSISAGRVIDCTGDASVAELAGYEVLHPFPCQPATYSCKLSGYDPAALDWESLKIAADKAVNCGELLYTDLGWNKHAFTGHFLKVCGNNGNHILPEVPPHSAEGRSALEEAGRASVLRAWRFLRKQKGLKNLQIDVKSFECGVRESSVIRGEYTIRDLDYVNAVKFYDAICNAFYPVDLHDDDGVTQARLADGAVPQVPLRALIPQNSRFMLVAGRCIASERKANSALRVQASCMATAQAAGAAAVISLQDSTAVGSVDIEKVRTLLRRHKAILPDI